MLGLQRYLKRLARWMSIRLVLDGNKWTQKRKTYIPMRVEESWYCMYCQRKTVSGIAHEVTVGSTFRCGKPGCFPQENDLEMGFENIYVGLPEAVL